MHLGVCQALDIFCYLVATLWELATLQYEADQNGPRTRERSLPDLAVLANGLASQGLHVLGTIGALYQGQVERCTEPLYARYRMISQTGPEDAAQSQDDCNAFSHCFVHKSTSLQKLLSS